MTIAAMVGATEVAREQRHAGQYASDRHHRGLASYRRRLYRYAGRALLIIVVVELAVAIYLRSTFGWATFAFVLGAFVGMVAVLRDAAPHHIRHWGDGAWGEQQTAKALTALEQEGWMVRHDVQLERGNIDHVVETPRGRPFILETKALSGRITVEGGVLTTTQVDDPEQIFRNTELRRTVLSRAWRQHEERGGRGGWVQAAVVIWGDFPQRRVEDGKLVFLHGEELVDWLREKGS